MIKKFVSSAKWICDKLVSTDSQDSHFASFVVALDRLNEQGKDIRFKCALLVYSSYCKTSFFYRGSFPLEILGLIIQYLISSYKVSPDKNISRFADHEAKNIVPLIENRINKILHRTRCFEELLPDATLKKM